LSRDLLAVWSKMREVLYPRYLFGGTMFESEDGLRGAYANLRGAGLQGAREELGGLVGRVMDTETLLGQSHMTPGLRDWDLWGPLIFCLALSALLSFRSREEQRGVVFSGVFAMVWIGEAVVTMQIKLLGGNMWVTYLFLPCFNPLLLRQVGANFVIVPSHRAFVSLDTPSSH